MCSYSKIQKRNCSCKDSDTRYRSQMYGGPRTKLRLVPIPLHTFCPDAEYHYSPDTNYTNLVENSWDDRTRNGRRESTLPNTQSTKVLQWSWSPYAHEPFEWNNNENYLSIVKNNGAVLISTEFTLQLIDSIAICTSRDTIGWSLSTNQNVLSTAQWIEKCKQTDSDSERSTVSYM